MKYTALVENKKRFLQYFLNHYELKNVKCYWLLEHIMFNDVLLENLYFVQSIEDFKKGIIISTTCSEESGFCFHKEHLQTKDVEKAFHELRLHPEEKVYLQLNFKGAPQNKYYQQILSDSYIINDSISTRKKLQVITNLEIQLLKEQINNAIDRGDQQTFIILSKELKNKLLAREKDQHEVDK